MGSPVSMIVCDAMMEDIEQKAIETAPHPPHWWYRYVDDTNTKLDSEYAQEFTDHLNTLDPDIKFTTEGEEDGELAFLDTSTSKKDDGSLKLKIYRKPTHTDQYPQFDSNHPLEHKLSVVCTLHHRAKTVVTEEMDRVAEVKHVNEALSKCGYPSWAIKRGSVLRDKEEAGKKDRTDETKKTMVGIPYVKDLSEAVRRIMSGYGCSAYFKPVNTLRQLLVAPKDPAKKEDVCDVVYQINCGGSGSEGCSSSYVGETSKTLKTRFDQHRRPSSTSSHVSLHLH